MKLNNKYYLLRHGEAKSNVKNVVSCWPEIQIATELGIPIEYIEYCGEGKYINSNEI